MNVTALMESTVKGCEAKSRLGSNLFQGKFSHVLLGMPANESSFITLRAVFGW
ncbi:hypothetical protein F385_110 [Pantoea agglomerans 299R]|nr:hypothetical protein F385_110 [Pantoea agglomerans 299R]